MVSESSTEGFFDGAGVEPTYGSPVGIVLVPNMGSIDTGVNNDGEAKDGTLPVGLKTSGGDFVVATGDNFVAAGFEGDVLLLHPYVSDSRILL